MRPLKPPPSHSGERSTLAACVFAGLGIIHTAKKDVPQVLFQKYSKELAPNVDVKWISEDVRTGAPATICAMFEKPIVSHGISSSGGARPRVFRDLWALR
ncbi:hypothetical protein EVAR_48010_1 [Eumeta japonica]|uniref:Uncharacterized protein n=1 Tax=Eumeta variegata TaxID=151549 RepID=A0A4C1XRW8_EUMVA|nr:hypothetical protein EVAR_48010_1 [Eumeta japonica]